jgi:methylthioribose-1-phosphate isomerase
MLKETDKVEEPPLRMRSGINPVSWVNNAVELLDQRQLPARETYLRLEYSHEVATAIRDMAVRGAPAIGIAAAYGIVLAARQSARAAGAGWQALMEPLLQELAATRPTAVNLSWAIARMRRRFPKVTGDPEGALLAEAKAIHAEDVQANLRMGELGASLIGDAGAVLTHCNAGALATGGYGTALGVVRFLHATKKLRMVYACETRPWLQGARLTAWELAVDKIPVTLIADGAAGSLMRSGKIGWVIVGADRIAANGDVANKIGTYAHAVCARHHGVRFMVVAPTSTIDMQTATGDQIPVEERDGRELTHCGGQAIAPRPARTHNPVFDITPAGLVDFLVTEKGVLERPDPDKMRVLMG